MSLYEQGDRSKATPLEYVVTKLGLDGITGSGAQFREFRVHPPCLIHATIVIPPKGGKKVSCHCIDCDAVAALFQESEARGRCVNPFQS